MATRYGNISDAAVRKATGKGWDEWIARLDAAGAEAMPHKDIASMLTQDDWLGEGEGWWAQAITVGYEYAKGRRVKGETAAAGFETGVQKTIAVEAHTLWDFLTSIDGLRLWLGELDGPIPLEKGARYETAAGTRGEIRSARATKRLRLTWQPADWPEAGTLQLYLDARNGRTALRFHHEKLPDADHRAQMTEHWGGF